MKRQAAPKLTVVGDTYQKVLAAERRRKSRQRAITLIAITGLGVTILAWIITIFAH